MKPSHIYPFISKAPPCANNRFAVVTQNSVLLALGIFFRGRCPHPQETEFLDFPPILLQLFMQKWESAAAFPLNLLFILYNYTHFYAYLYIIPMP